MSDNATRTDSPEEAEEARRAERRERRAEKKAHAKILRKAAKRKAYEERMERTAWLQRRVAGLLRFVLSWAKAVGRVRAGTISGRIARMIGPLIKENKLAAGNLEAAFPEKSKKERDKILSGLWDNLGHQLIEYAFIAELAESFDPDHLEDGPFTVDGLEHLYALRDSGKPGIIFGAHFGNWELAPAVSQKLGVPITGLYRPPKNRYLAEEMERLRGDYISTLVASGRGAAMRVAGALRSGHTVGILVDQRIAEGDIIPFMGRPSLSNPAVGVLARLFDCPVHGAYAKRMPNGRFHLLMTPPLDLPRDAKGKVDADATNVMVHGIVEEWVREAPEQWLWVHDRWRYGRRKHAKQF